MKNSKFVGRIMKTTRFSSNVELMYRTLFRDLLIQKKLIVIEEKA